MKVEMIKIISPIVTGFLILVVGCKESSKKEVAPAAEAPTTLEYQEKINQPVSAQGDESALDELKIDDLSLHIRKKETSIEKLTKVINYIQQIDEQKSSLILETKILSDKDKERLQLNVDRVYYYDNLDELISIRATVNVDETKKSFVFYFANDQLVLGTEQPLDALDHQPNAMNSYIYYEGFWLNKENKKTKEDADMIYKLGVILKALRDD